MRIVKKKKKACYSTLCFWCYTHVLGSVIFWGVWGGLGERRLISLTFLTPGVGLVEYYENSAKSLFCKEIKGVPFTQSTYGGCIHKVFPSQNRVRFIFYQSCSLDPSPNKNVSLHWKTQSCHFRFFRLFKFMR